MLELTDTNIHEVLTLFDQGHYPETETRARELTVLFPTQGFGWKVLGVVLRQQGQISDSLYPMQKAAELLPDDAEAHSNLGVTLMNQGLLADAILSYRRALELYPDYTDVHHNLGLTLMTLGQLMEASDCFRRVLELNPNYSDAYYNLGRIFQEQGQPSEAEDYYRRVLETHPELSDVHSNLAWVLHNQGRLSEAEASYRYALALNPQDVKAYSHLGLILQTQGRLPEAQQCYQQALLIYPQFAELHNNLGIVFHELGLAHEAEGCYQRALAIKPNYSEAYNNLGLSLQKRGLLADAETAYRNALTHNPHNPEVHNNLGIVFQEREQFMEAEASYQRALTIKPNDAQVHNNLGEFYKALGRFAEAEASFCRVLAINPDYIEAHSNLLFAMNYNPVHSPADYLAEACRYGLKVKNKIDSAFTSWHCEEKPERLRIGMVFANLSSSVVGFLSELDSSCIELIAYPTHSKADEFSAYFSASKSLTNLDDEAAARLIHADGVHILLDLAGHGAYNRLPVFAWKPAPIQVNCLGLLNTTGVVEMDYILGDPYTTPLASSNCFSETIWQLPESYCCFSVPEITLDINELPALTNYGVTFGSFNPLSLMTDAVVALWARILNSVLYSQLLLKNGQLDNALVRQTTCQRFAQQGILPERLILEGASSRAELLAAYQRVDIALDTFPYNGTNTSADALWMAVPVITRTGDCFISRCGESILSNAELDDWVATDDDDYLAKAVYFSWDIANLAELRTQLREKILTSPLFDATNFARNFEAALWSMYQQ
jgi:predicted O-linked N-acetylglucosamine transferase (SPINDLY family)